MEWMMGAALIPLLFCGAMCAGSAALAAFGLRRGLTGNKTCCDQHTIEADSAGNRDTVTT